MLRPKGHPLPLTKVSPDFTIDDLTFPDSGFFYTHHCTVDALTEGQFLTIDLAECKVDPDDPDEPAVTHTIDAEISPGAPIDLSVGDAVRFTNFADGPWWVNRGFALRRPDDELVLAGLSTAELPGENFGPPPDLLAPFTFTVEVACELEPLDTECDFIYDNCYQLRRDVLRLQWAAGATVDAIDRSAHTWPDEPYLVVVGRAEYHALTGNCSDQTGRWVRLMLLRAAAGSQISVMLLGETGVGKELFARAQLRRNRFNCVSPRKASCFYARSNMLAIF